MTNMQNFQPLVTVYITTYNRIQLLQRAVESVRCQTYKNIEIIIVDDCSSDATYEYLKYISSKDSRVRYFIKETNSGACASRNIAINNARGLFITGLDDDDYFEHNRIQVFIDKAKKDHNMIYFTSFKTQISSSYIKTPSFLSHLKRKKITSSRELLKRNFISNQVFILTTTIKECGGFDENLKAWQDLECWYNIMEKKKITASFINEPTQVIDISHDHERITTKKLENILESYQYIVDKHNLKNLDEFILRGQLIYYMPDTFSKKRKLLQFLITKDRSYLSI